MKKIFQFWKKTSNWCKITIYLIILLFILQLCNNTRNQSEGFQQKEKFTLKKDKQIYDDFYVDVYDELMGNRAKEMFECNEIAKVTKINTHSSILDIGSGIGNHVNIFDKMGASCKGIDNSIAMINHSKYKHNHCDFKYGDAMDFMNFKENSFTHITCLFFTIYYFKDKTRFLKNCYDWLLPQGYLAIHMVNRQKFDPILEAANPLFILSPQKYAKKRITNSIVKFNNFDYKANFKLNGDIANFDEFFKDKKTAKIRQNQHTLFMESQKEIISIAKKMGFILKGKIDMIGCQYEYQYIYIFYKH